MDTTEREFTTMVNENRSTIYSVCYMFSKDRDEVNDLFQEVLINLWKGFAKYKDQGTERSWIYRVSLNTCISYDRKKQKSVPLPIGFDVFEDDESSRRQVEQLHERISKLQPLDRALVLLWLDDISYDEIGAIMGISAKNVSVKLVRIKEQLKNMSNH